MGSFEGPTGPSRIAGPQRGPTFGDQHGNGRGHRPIIAPPGARSGLPVVDNVGGAVGPSP